jgi:outer membrane receptor for ferrienterochelin and colicins
MAMLLCGLIVLHGPGAYASAEAGDTRTARLDPVVVTGTRTEKRLADSPVRVEIVDAEELRRTHARTLDEALANVPGLQLREVHGKSGQELSLQGLTSDQVLVLIDGLPIAASTGSTVDLSQYTLAEVQRIEIVKGATSAQYGSAAMGGVINVITRRIEPGFSGALRAEAGSYGSQNPSGDRVDIGSHYAQARVEGGSEHWRARLAADVLDDDGFSIAPERWAQQGDAVRRMQYAARMEWLPTPQGQLWLEGNHYRQRDDSRYEYYAAPNWLPQNKLENVQRNRASGGGHWMSASGVRYALMALDERYRGDVDAYSGSARITDRNARLGQRQLSTQVDLPGWARQSWTAGLDYRRETLAQTVNGGSELTTDGEVSRDSREVWLQNDVQFAPRLELLLGLRAQDDSDFGGHLAPKIALRAGLPMPAAWEGSLRAAYGQGYRVPNLKERHYLFDHSALGYQVIGNPDLDPESSHSWQLGVTATGPRGINAELNLFLNHVRDLIQTDLDNARIENGIALYSYENIARARTQGVETALRWQATSWLGLNAAYTYTEAKDRDSGEELTRRPRHMARLGVDLDAPLRTTLSLRLRHQSREQVDTSNGTSPAWTLLDLKLNHDTGRGIDLYAGIDNLFDRQRDFADADDFSPLVGRFLYLGAAYRWAAL